MATLNGELISDAWTILVSVGRKRMFPKFRAWVDTQTGFYRDNNGKFRETRRKFMESNIRTIQRKAKYISPYDEMIGEEGIWFSFDDAVFMRATSTKDKNGKEIYEKDIVKDEKGHKYIVEFIILNNFCGFQMIPIKCNRKQSDKCSLWKHSEVEVVGNVFENDEYKYYRKGGYIKRWIKELK